MLATTYVFPWFFWLLSAWIFSALLPILLLARSRDKGRHSRFFPRAVAILFVLPILGLTVDIWQNYQLFVRVAASSRDFGAFLEGWLPRAWRSVAELSLPVLGVSASLVTVWTLLTRKGTKVMPKARNREKAES